MVKAVTSAIIIFILGKVLNYSDISWCLISAVLVLSPDSKDAIPLALTRIKANLAGGFASLLCLLLGQPNIYTLSLAIILSISICHVLKLMPSSRSGLAAVIIIMLHKGGPEYSLWGMVLERVISVISGCLLGLLVTYVFHRNLGHEVKKAPEELPVADE